MSDQEGPDPAAAELLRQAEDLKLRADSLGATARYPHERAEVYVKASQLAEKAGAEELARQVNWDFQLFRMSTGGLLGPTKQRFGPAFELEDGTKFPDPDALPDDALTYYGQRAQSLADPVAKAQYCDFLWINRARIDNAHTYARLAIEAYLEAARMHQKQEHWFPLADSVTRAVELATALNDRKLIEESSHALLEWLRVLAGDPQTVRYILEPSNRATAINGVDLKPEEWKELASLLEEGGKHFGREKNRLLEPQFYEAAMEAAKRAGSGPDFEGSLRRAIAESREADALEQGVRSRLVEADLLIGAIKAYEEIGDTKKADELYLRLAAATEAAKAEFIPISARVQIPAGSLDSAVAELTKGDLEEATLRTAGHMVPSLTDAEARYQRDRNETPLAHLIGRTILSGDNIVYRTGDEAAVRETLILEKLHQDFIFKMSLLFRGAKIELQRKGLCTSVVIARLDSVGCFQSDTLSVVEKGLNLYFEGKLIESIHILVPQLEDLYRELLRSMSVPTTARNRHRGGVEEIFLERILREPKIEVALGRDYVVLAELNLVDRRGENLRNRVAHGLLKAGSEDQSLSEIVLLHLLILGSLKGTGADAEGPEQTA